MLQILREQMGQTMRLIWSLGAFVATAMAMFIVTAEVPMSQLYQLQTTWSPDEFAAIIQNWREFGILVSFQAHFTLDFIYPLFYAAMLVALLSKSMNNAQASERANMALLMPLLAMIADWGENACHLAFLGNPELVQSGWFYLGPIFANLKWWLINLSLLTAAYYFIKTILARLSQRGQKKS